jgi:hypothetical protein
MKTQTSVKKFPLVVYHKNLYGFFRFNDTKGELLSGYFFTGAGLNQQHLHARQG